MRILITNDDSVSASQLIPLIRFCQGLGEVTTVVPKYEQSGKSHSIELHKPFEVKHTELEPGLWVYTVDSSPADCVRYAVLGMEKEFDLVISGINRGYNLGMGIMYSGTAAAVFEAAAFGLKAIALSTSYKSYEEAPEHLQTVFDFVEKHDLLSIHDIYNINIPPQPKGIRVTRQGGPYYSDLFEHQGNDMYMPIGKCVHEFKNDMTIDADAAIAGYISVCPLTVNRTDMAVFDKIKGLSK